MLNIILLGITSLLTDISSEMVYPILPVFLVTTLGASPAILGLIEGMAESLASLLKVFSGYFSDKIRRRKPFTILGYVSSILGKLFLYLSFSWPTILVGRVIDRFGKGIRSAPRDALIAESSQEGKRGAAFGLHRAMDTLGATIGVVLAYFLVTRFQGNLRHIFLFSLIPAGLGVLILFLVKEKDKPTLLNPKRLFSFALQYGIYGRASENNSAKQHRIISLDLRSRIEKGFSIKGKWRALDKRLKLFLLFTFIFTLGNSSNQFLLLRAKNLGSSIPKVILFYLVYNIVYCLSIYPASRLSDRIGRKKLLSLGYLVYGLVYLGFASNKSLSMFWFLFGLYGLSIGFTEGVEKALVSDIAPAELRATAIGLHASLVGIGLLPASLFAGMLWKFFGPAAPFYFGAFMGILASAGFWFVVPYAPPHQLPQGSPS